MGLSGVSSPSTDRSAGERVTRSFVNERNCLRSCYCQTRTQVTQQAYARPSVVAQKHVSGMKDVQAKRRARALQSLLSMPYIRMQLVR